MSAPDRPPRGFTLALRCGLVLLVATLIVVTLHPADGAEVERGGALWLAPFLLAPLLLGPLLLGSLRMASLQSGPWRGKLDRLDGLVIGMLLWLLITLVLMRGSGDLRAAVNEYWWWLGGGVFWIAARRLLASTALRSALLAMLVALAAGEATLAAHQHWVSLPADRARFEASPDTYLDKLGIVAPEGSAERELFRARLSQGGATGTFALANSLGGFLLVGLVLASGMVVDLAVHRHRAGSVNRAGSVIGADRSRSQGWSWWGLAVAGGTLAMCTLGMLWGHSRSAMLGGGIGILWGLAGPLLVRRMPHYGRGWVVWIAIGTLAALPFVLAAFPSLWPSLPRTIEFRCQYWRSSAALLADAPLLGAGLGNFQDRYLRYRLDEASEGIADPHHWWVETLVAGGIPAGILLLLTLGWGGQASLRRWEDGERGERFEIAPEVTSESRAGESGAFWPLAMAVGALAGVVFSVWAWVREGVLPDPDGLLGAIVVAAVVGGVSFGIFKPRGASAPSFFRGPQDDWSPWLGGVALGLLVHWTFAGGWTVPGTSLPWLVVTAILTVVVSGTRRSAGFAQAPGAPQVPAKTTKATQRSGPSAAARAPVLGPAIGLARGPALGLLAIGVTGAMLLLAWVWSAWGMVLSQRDSEEQGRREYLRGNFRLAASIFAALAQADPWGLEPSMREAESWHWELLQGQAEDPQVRTRWAEALGQAQRRSPHSPLVAQLHGEQLLVLYQRFGDRADLREADEAFRRAAEFSPGEIRYAAQLAAIADALEDHEEAGRWWDRADQLSRAGDHQERRLEKIFLLVPKPLGRGVASGGGVRQSSQRLREEANSSALPAPDPSPASDPAAAPEDAG